MRRERDPIERYSGAILVAAALLVAVALLIGACSSDGERAADAGGSDATSGVGGRGGTSAGGAGGGGAGMTGGASATGGSGGAGGGGAGTTGAAGGGAGTTGRTGGGGAGTTGGGGRGGSAGTTGGGGGGQGGGGTCTPTSCGSTQFCDLFVNACVAGTGSCKPRPQDCIVSAHKVCACDGKIYDSECEANGAGQDLSDAGGCSPPSGMFPCGPYFCAHGGEYCAQTLTPGFPVPGIFQCMALPAACGATPTCACVPSCTSCAVSTAGDLTSTCLRL